MRQDLIRALARELLNELLVSSKQKVDWSDIGFTATEEADLNQKPAQISRQINPVVLLDPTTNPMSLVAPATSAGDDPSFGLTTQIQIPYTYSARTTPVFKYLYGNFTAGTAAARYITLEQPRGTDYQVPASKIFYMLNIQGRSQAAAAGDNMSLGYGDDAVAEGTTAPTNWLPLVGASFASGDTESWIHGVDTVTPFNYNIFAAVPASKYPAAARAAVATQWSFNVVGIEVDA